MKSLRLLIIFAISSSSHGDDDPTPWWHPNKSHDYSMGSEEERSPMSPPSYHHHHHGHLHGDGDPTPWRDPNTSDDYSMGSDEERNPMSPPSHHHHYGHSHGDGDPWMWPNKNKDPLSPPGGGGWHPWGRPTTEKPTRMTYPTYSSSSTTTTESVTTMSTTTASGLNLVIESCKATCLVTNEHNPVCGTDNVTYGNIGRLECARNCGVDVQLKRKSPCGQALTDSIITPDQGGNGNGVIDNAAILACMRNCPVTSEYNPVCGSDNVTYGNPGRFQCAKDCGATIHISRKTPCSVPAGFEDAINSCIQTCSVTSGFNPVCGTNNVTYHNAGLLECAQNCGLDVQISRRSLCSVPPGPDNPELRGTSEKPNGNGGGSVGNVSNDGSWNNNGNANNNGGNSFNGNNAGNGNSSGSGNNGGNGNNNGNGNKSITEIIACMQLCPITPETNPVCGTDGVTYTNPGMLLCSQFCGIDVSVQKFAPCLGQLIPQPNFYPTLPTPTDVFTNPPTTHDCINRCPVTQEFKPVCGSDGVTYINLGSLQCQMKCGVGVSVDKLTACGQISTDRPTAPIPPTWFNTDRPIHPIVVTHTPLTPTPTPTPTPNNDIQACINICFTTQEYKPVCGTDGETYANLPKLQCAKQCGINVDLKSMTPCNSNPTFDGSKNGITEYNTPPTPQTTKDDSDESYGLDKRFGKP